MKADFCSDSAINGKCINWTKKLDTYMSPLQNHANELFIEHKDFAVV